VAPRSEQEQHIAAIWAELLELDEVGVEDNFFELGGDSLLAMRMALAVERANGRIVPPQFFRLPTIRNLSGLLQSNPVSGATEAAADISMAERQSSHMPAPRPAPRRPVWRRVTWHALMRRLRRSVEDAIFAQAHDQVWRRLSQWCATAARLGLYAPELALLNEMQRALGSQRAVTPEQQQAYLMGNLLMQQWRRLPRASHTSSASDVLQAATQPFWSEIWRLGQQGTPNELAVQFSFAGWEALELAYQRDRGVILISYHSPGLPLVSQAISRRLGCEPILTNVQYGGFQANRRGAQQARFLASELTAATSERTVRSYQQLRRGGIVHFANDHGYTLNETMACRVADRQYQFKTSFAEMARSTGAVIVPTFAFCTPQGQIHEVFLSPFAFDAADSAPERFTRIALDQYADFLQRSWCAQPASLQWGVIERHLQQPVVGLSE
jgi:acyl carrier protein